MNTQHVPTLPAARLPPRPHRHGALTRRQFLQAGLATMAAGAGLGQAGAALAAPSAKSTADPRPIPYGSQFLFPNPRVFHADAPGYPGMPFDTNPAISNPGTITDFHGSVGLTYVGGQGTHRYLPTGAPTKVYWEVDMRFMVGVYVGTDSRHHHGTFCLI